MVKSIRIFVSSPGDVKAAREKARAVIDQLQRWYGDRVRLEPVFWEQLPLQLDSSFQDGIDAILSEDQGIDIAVFILWSRLGSPVGGMTKKKDGSPYRSGTEREFDLMLAAREASGGERPAILAYLKRNDAAFQQLLQERASTTGQMEEMIQQRKLAEAFVRETFKDEEGRNLRAYHSFDQPVSFAGRLKVHLRALIDDHLESDEGLDKRWNQAPYRGLESFDLEHADIFFGREEEVAQLEAQLRTRASDPDDGCAFVAVIGASGSGKSSLVKAGLGASLTRFNLDDSVAQWRYATLVPGETGGDPIGGLLAQFSADDAVPELQSSDIPAEDWKKAVHDSPETAIDLGLKPALKKASETAGGPVRLLLAIDQFEELFTDPGISEEERESFLGAVEALSRSGFCWIVATLRSDLYGLAQKSEAFLRLKGESGQFDLLPPGPEALRQIITEPARMAGASFETRDPEQGGQSLAAQILADAQSQPDLLPLLSDLLLELYQRRGSEDDQITFSAYEELGRLEGALSQRAETIIDSLNAEEQEAFPAVLRDLITVEAESAVRRRTRKDELSSRPEKQALVESLIQARLLTAEGDGKSAWVSLAHEALLRKWDRISAWVNENRAALRQRAQVESYYHRWEDGGRDASLLLPKGLPLEEGLSLLRHGRQLLNGSQRDYVRQSQRHHRGRMRILVGVLSGFLALALVGGAFALFKSIEAESERIAAEKARENADDAREDAEELVGFMLGDLKEELAALGKLELLEDTINQVEIYYDQLGNSLEEDERLRKSIAGRLKAEVLEAIGNYTEAEQVIKSLINELEALLAAEADNEELMAELLMARALLARILRVQGDAEAESIELESGVRFASAIEVQATSHEKLLTAIAEINLAMVQMLSRRDSTDEVFYDVMYEYVRRTLEVYTKLRSEGVNHSRVRRSHAVALASLWPRTRLGDKDFIEQTFGEALAMVEELVADNPEDARNLFAKAQVLVFKADAYELIGEYSDGLEAGNQGITILEHLFDLDRDNQIVAYELTDAYHNSAYILKTRGYRAEAMQYYKKSLAISEHFVERLPDNQLWEEQVTGDLFRIGDMSVDPNEKIHYLELALERIRSDQSAHSHGGIAVTDWEACIHHYLSNAYRMNGNIENALLHGKEGVRLYDLAADYPHRMKAYARLSLGKAYVNCGNLIAAEGLFKEAVDIARSVRQTAAYSYKSNYDSRGPLNDHIEVLRYLGEWNKLERASLELVEVNLALHSAFPEDLSYLGDLANSWLVVGEARTNRGAKVEAEDAYRKALKVLENFIVPLLKHSFSENAGSMDVAALTTGIDVSLNVLSSLLNVWAKEPDPLERIGKLVSILGLLLDGVAPNHPKYGLAMRNLVGLEVSLSELGIRLEDTDNIERIGRLMLVIQAKKFDERTLGSVWGALGKVMNRYLDENGFSQTLSGHH